MAIIRGRHFGCNVSGRPTSPGRRRLRARIRGRTGGRRDPEERQLPALSGLADPRRGCGDANRRRPRDIRIPAVDVAPTAAPTQHPRRIGHVNCRRSPGTCQSPPRMWGTSTACFGERGSGRCQGPSAGVRGSPDASKWTNLTLPGPGCACAYRFGTPRHNRPRASRGLSSYARPGPAGGARGPRGPGSGPGQPVPDSWSRTAGPGQPSPDSWSRTALPASLSKQAVDLRGPRPVIHSVRKTKRPPDPSKRPPDPSTRPPDPGTTPAGPEHPPTGPEHPPAGPGHPPPDPGQRPPDPSTPRRTPRTATAQTQRSTLRPRNHAREAPDGRSQDESALS